MSKDVKQLSDWDLIVAFNGLAMEVTSVSKRIRTEVVNETWKHQDGYGAPGQTPVQGWDWSGIRDSSPKAVSNMANTIRQILEKYNITEIDVRDDHHPDSEGGG